MSLFTAKTPQQSHVAETEPESPATGAVAQDPAVVAAKTAVTAAAACRSEAERTLARTWAVLSPPANTPEPSPYAVRRARLDLDGHERAVLRAEVDLEEAVAAWTEATRAARAARMPAERAVLQAQLQLVYALLERTAEANLILRDLVHAANARLGPGVGHAGAFELHELCWPELFPGGHLEFRRARLRAQNWLAD